MELLESENLVFVNRQDLDPLSKSFGPSYLRN